MLTYRDMTFCVSPNCKNECERKLTAESVQSADLWWYEITGKDGGAPIASAYFCDKHGNVIG